MVQHHECALIWANGGTGRRGGLKSRWTYVHKGSSPFSPIEDFVNIKKFLDINFLKFLFLSLNGRINRKTWWYSQFFLVFFGVLMLIPLSSLLGFLNFDEFQVEKLVSFLVLLISALSIFPDSKRLQDRSINGLLAILPYIFAIPLQFHFVPEFFLKFYIICMWALKAYIFINTGVLKGDDGSNKYGELDNFKS